MTSMTNSQQNTVDKQPRQRLAFADDSSYYLLCSLEVLDEDNNLKRKADMFTKRTIKPSEVVTSVDTASEALAVSIAEKAKVDIGICPLSPARPNRSLQATCVALLYGLQQKAMARTLGVLR